MTIQYIYTGTYFSQKTILLFSTKKSLPMFETCVCDHWQAIEALQTATRAKPTAPMFMLLGKTQMKAKLYKDAISSFELALNAYVSKQLITLHIYQIDLLMWLRFCIVFSDWIDGELKSPMVAHWFYAKHISWSFLIKAFFIKHMFFMNFFFFMIIFNYSYCCFCYRTRIIFSLT